MGKVLRSHIIIYVFLHALMRTTIIIVVEMSALSVLVGIKEIMYIASVSVFRSCPLNLAV